mgnify:CR=1 FL=1
MVLTTSKYYCYKFIPTGIKWLTYLSKMGKTQGRPGDNGLDFLAIKRSHLMCALGRIIEINSQKAVDQKIGISMRKE